MALPKFWIREDVIFHSNPAECVILPGVEKIDIHPLTDGQVKDSLKAASSEDHKIDNPLTLTILWQSISL